MSSYKENFSGVQGSDFSLMPEGLYKVAVIEARVAESKKGNLTWYIDLEVIDENYAGSKLWFMVGMSENAKAIRKGTLTALGIDTSDTANPDLIDDVIGCRAMAEIYHDEWNGEKRAKVKRLRSIKKDAEDEFADSLEKNEIPFD